MSSIDGTIVSVGLDAMQVDLTTTLALVGWTLTAYMLTQTVVMPMAGKISDDWGRKRLFLGSIALFTASSIAAGLAPNIYWLIVFRVVQAIGGGVFMPCAVGIVGDTFGERRHTWIGLFTAIFPLGGIIGPNIGGVIIDHLSWRWMFFVNGPIGLLLLVAGLRVLPPSRPIAQKRPLDMVGASLFAAGLVTALAGLTNWANHPDEASSFFSVWLLVMVGIMLLIVFLWHETRTEFPMVELGLLKRKEFAAANAYAFLFGSAVFGFFNFMPYYAIVGFGLSAAKSGELLTPRSVASMLFSLLASFSLTRFGYRLPMIVGLAMIAACMFLLSLGFHDVTMFGTHIPNSVLLAMETMLAGIGTGICNPASQNAALDLHPDKIGAVAGLRGMFSQVGGILGTTGVILALSHFSDKRVGMDHVFLFSGIILLIAIPFVLMIPDRKRSPAPRTAPAPTPITAATPSKTR